MTLPSINSSTEDNVPLIIDKCHIYQTLNFQILSCFNYTSKLTQNYYAFMYDSLPKFGKKIMFLVDYVIYPLLLIKQISCVFINRYLTNYNLYMYSKAPIHNYQNLNKIQNQMGKKCGKILHFKLLKQKNKPYYIFKSYKFFKVLI